MIIVFEFLKHKECGWIEWRIALSSSRRDRFADRLLTAVTGFTAAHVTWAQFQSYQLQNWYYSRNAALVQIIGSWSMRGLPTKKFWFPGTKFSGETSDLNSRRNLLEYRKSSRLLWLKIYVNVFS